MIMSTSALNFIYPFIYFPLYTYAASSIVSHDVDFDRKIFTNLNDGKLVMLDQYHSLQERS